MEGRQINDTWQGKTFPTSFYVDSGFLKDCPSIFDVRVTDQKRQKDKSHSGVLVH